MENLLCSLSAEKYDKVLREGPLPEGGDLRMYVKPDATKSGKAGIMFTFTVELPNGEVRRAQAVTTVALFEAAAAAIKGWREAGLLL